jgi:hypothetical protein
MVRLRAYLAVALFAIPSLGQTPESKPMAEPKLPFYDWGICPGEGCQYGRWKARKKILVYNTWKPGRRTIAHLSPGDSVIALTGGVITYRPGVLRISRDDLEHGLRAGDKILTYTYLGEGFSAVWFRGRFYHDFDTSYSYGEEGEKIWWAKVRLNSGRVGWVNMNQSHFDGTCSLAASQ